MCSTPLESFFFFLVRRFATFSAVTATLLSVVLLLPLEDPEFHR